MHSFCHMLIEQRERNPCSSHLKKSDFERIKMFKKLYKTFPFVSLAAMGLQLIVLHQAPGVLGMPRFSKMQDLLDYNNVTGEEFCVDQGFDDEATCASAHVLAPNNDYTADYGSMRKVKCCKWDSENDKCTSGLERPDFYCIRGMPSSVDRFFLIYTRERLVGERGRAIKVAIQVILRVVGLASLVGSLYIIHSLAGTRARCEKNLRQQPRSRTNVVFNRLFLGLSISDAVSSFMFFLASWMIPSYQAWAEGVMKPWSEELYYDFFPWASGTMGTCYFQGIVLYFNQSVSVSLSGAVALQYVLTVCFEWKNDKMLIFEKIMYAWSIALPLITCIIALAKDAVGATVTGFCWISTNPWYCNEYTGCSGVYPAWNPQSTITEWNIRYFVMAQVFLNLLIVLISMVMLFCAVRKQEKRAARWSQTAAEGRASKKVIYKAILLIGTYLVVYVPAIVCLFFDHWYPQTIPLVMVIFLPCQGIFNALVYSDKLTSNVHRRSSLGGRLSFFRRFSGVRSSQMASSQQNSRGSSNASSAWHSLFGGLFRRRSSMVNPPGKVDASSSTNLVSAMTMTDRNSTSKASVSLGASLGPSMGALEHSESCAANIHSNPLAVPEGEDLKSSEGEELESDAADVDLNSLAVNEDAVEQKSELGSEMDVSLRSICESTIGAGANDEEIGPFCSESETEVEGNDCCDEDIGSGNDQTNCNESRTEAEGNDCCDEENGPGNVQTN